MNLLPKWVLPPTLPSIYESESFTSLEMVSKLYGAMNELITECNNFVTSATEKMETFTAETEEQYNSFAVGLRQEFQDFIDVINLKCTAQQNEINTAIANMEKIAKREVNAAIESGAIEVTTIYDPETETLRIVAGGEA